MTKIVMSDHDGWKIEVVMGTHPYPILSYNNEPYSILFNRDIPIVVQEKFWKTLQEYNIFLEVEEDGCE